MTKPFDDLLEKFNQFIDKIETVAILKSDDGQKYIEELRHLVNPHVRRMVIQFTEPKQEPIGIMMLACITTMMGFIHPYIKEDDKLEETFNNLYRLNAELTATYVMARRHQDHNESN